jgi:site-specific recombinase XerD
MYEALYEYYYKQETEQGRTFEEAMEAWLKYKRENHNTSNNTVVCYRYLLHRFFTDDFMAMKIRDIDRDYLQKVFVDRARAVCPTRETLKKALNYVKNTYEFAIDRGWCMDNPALTVRLQGLYSLCRLDNKTDDEKQFSPEEVLILQNDALEHPNSPRALMIVMASLTGMRVAELCSLKWSDVKSNYLHIHRQQLTDAGKKGAERLNEAGYTKNERENPRGGRKFPITDEIRVVLELAKKLPGSENSEYVFCNRKGGWTSKENYLGYLASRCRIHGIETTNNHAFRMALNSYFIRQGMTSSHRSLVLGHTIATNEHHYSLVDNRQFDELYNEIMAMQK